MNHQWGGNSNGCTMMFVLEILEHLALTEHGHAVRASFAFVRGIAVDDLLPLLGRNVQSVVNRHRDARPVHITGVFHLVRLQERMTTSDMPSNGVKVMNTMPIVAVIRAMPSV
jgi:hypothetical protein